MLLVNIIIKGMLIARRSFLVSTVCSLFIACPAVRTMAQESVKFEAEIKEDLVKPVDIAFSAAGEVYVLDAGSSLVRVFDADGKPVSSFGASGSLPGQFLSPRSIASVGNGRIAVADTNNNRVQVFNVAGEFLFAFGSLGSLPGQFKFLTGIAVDRGGFIYVADRDNRRVQVFSPNGIFMREIGLEGKPVDLGITPQGYILALLPDSGKIVRIAGDGKKTGEVTLKSGNRDELAKSERLEVDPWGDILLSQPGDQRIVKIDRDGNVLLTFGSEGNARGQFNGIAGLVVNEAGIVHAADSGNARLQVFKVLGPKKNLPVMLDATSLLVDFDSAVDLGANISDIYSMPGWGLFGVSDKQNRIFSRGRTESAYGTEGSGEGQVLAPSSVYVTLDGRIFVADTGNHRVQIFGPDGAFIYAFGKNGTKSGQFNSPQGIAVSSRGMILVADTLNNRVQIFNQDGIYLNSIGAPLETTAKPAASDACKVLHSPKAVAFNLQDQLYVLDAEAVKVKVFDENGDCVTTIGGKGSGPGQFEKPVDIAVDENGHLYVADQANSRISIFDPQGEFVLSFGSPGTGNGYFKQISSVAVSEGRVFVADYLDDRVQSFRYSPDGLTGKPERFYATVTSAPLPGMEGNQVMRYTMARKLAFSEAVREFTENFGFSKEYLQRFVRIESIESLRDGKVKVTISIPKHIPKELRPITDPAPTSGGS